MIRIEIDSDGTNDGIKHFEMKGNHERVIEECGIALYNIIYAFQKQYRDIEYPNTEFDYIVNVREYFQKMMDCAELNAAGFEHDESKGDLSEDDFQQLESMHDSTLIFLNEGEEEPPEIDKLFMDVRYRNPDELDGE